MVEIAVIAKAFMNLGVVLKSAISQAFDVLFEWIGKIPKLGEALGLAGYKAGSFGETYQRERENAAGANQMLNDLFGSGAARVGKGNSGIGEAFARAKAGAGGEAQDKFTGLINELLGNRKARAKGGAAPGPGGGEDYDFGGGKSGGAFKGGGTDLEKLGFVFGAGTNNSAATKAKNTTTLVRQMGVLIEVAGGAGENAFANAST
jgi:hypothetical protein